MTELVNNDDSKLISIWDETKLKNIISFSNIDYIFSIGLLLISTSVGIYFGFLKKRKNTTDEYLLGDRKMRPLPIAISLIASQLSGVAIISIPSEIYAFGSHHAWIVPDVVLFVTPILCFLFIYIGIPIFYNNNVLNCYEYLELRFCRSTRKIVTVAFLSTTIIVLPVIIFIPSLAFAQVTGFNIHLINGVVSAVCVFYTMLGGINAVVWTDVVQAGIMFLSGILVVIIGICKVGGLPEVLTRAYDGGSLNMFDMTFDLTTRQTFWNCFFGGIFLWSGYLGLNQSCVQRIVALPSLNHAKRSILMFATGFFVFMTFNCFTGALMFARYYTCDPVKAGFVEKPDKLMPFFVQDVVGQLKGMPGVFISCVFSAALSTMSANLNSLSGIIYFDYIKPFIKHTEARANFIMKILVTVTGIYSVLGGFVVEKFSSILQMIITIGGISQGAMVGVFTMGMLYPRSHSKGAFWGTLFSIVVMSWIAIGGQIALRNGELKYSPLPTRIDNCSQFDINPVNSSMTIINSIQENMNVLQDETSDPFSIYKISYNWYNIIGAFLVWIIGIPLSHLSKNNEEDSFNINLVSPLVHGLVPKKLRCVKVSQNERN